MNTNKTTIKINNRDLALSNLDKVLYPAANFTKSQILKYYSSIAPYILPHLKGRAMTLKRYPNGVNEDYFFEKRCPAHRPGWLETADIPYGTSKQLNACLVNNLETLVWVENLASIELHVPLCSAKTPLTPDSVVFDLDPGENAGVLECAKVALIIKGLLDNMKLWSAVKTSGKKGLHVYVPLNSGKTTFDDTKNFSRAIAGSMQNNYPGLVTSIMAKTSRDKKVFINWSQNDASKTMVAAYSLRAADKPMASTPLGWKELKAFLKKNDPAGLQFTYSQTLTRAKKNGDLFSAMLDKKQRLPYL